MLNKEDLYQILERSVDWYLVLKPVDGKLITCYANKVMRDNCTRVCAEAALEIGHEFSSCPAFSNLTKLIWQVVNTKDIVHQPEYKFVCHQAIPKYLDLQIYTNNGHIIICGRDLEPILYTLRISTAQLNEQLDTLIHKGELYGS